MSDQSQGGVSECLSERPMRMRACAAPSQSQGGVQLVTGLGNATASPELVEAREVVGSVREGGGVGVGNEHHLRVSGV